MLEVNKDLALSPTVLNKEVKKLVQLQDNFKSDDVKIYLTGTPIHSYYASSRSILEINIICILSTLFVIGLVYIFFSSFVPIIPIILSIGLGILAGFLTTVEIFRSIHILTFVFSTTLIGICVDYSLHYFVGGKKIFKSLTVGFLTTASAFLILLFSQFELLKQISVFTIAGLACVYSLVILFYPLVLKDNFTIRKLSFEFSDRAKHIILGFVVLVSLVGLVQIKFDDNIKNMYVPSKDLLQAEKLFAQVMKTNGETSFLVVKGDNFQDMLEKEELITDELALKEGYGEDLFSILGKLIANGKGDHIKRSNKEIDKDIEVTIDWLVVNIKELQYRKNRLKHSLNLLKLTTPSKYLSNAISHIHDRLFKHDEDRVVATLVNEAFILSSIRNKKFKAPSGAMDSSGRVKRLVSRDLDIYRAELERVNTVDDKIFLLERLHDLLDIAEYAKYMLETEPRRVMQSEQTIDQYIASLNDLIRATSNKNISKEKYGLYIKYPADYEG